LYDSHWHLNGNIIRDNLRWGIIISGTSFPRLENNEVFANTTAGIMIRDNSDVVLNKNKIHENYYQLSLRNIGKGKKTKAFFQNNAIDGANEIPNRFWPIF